MSTSDRPTAVTTDKVVCNRSSKVLVDALGIVHYSVIVDAYPKGFEPSHYDREPPFIVKMCDLIEAYDKATSWRDFHYPTCTYDAGFEYDGVPTCVACSGA